MTSATTTDRAAFDLLAELPTGTVLHDANRP